MNIPQINLIDRLKEVTEKKNEPIEEPDIIEEKIEKNIDDFDYSVLDNNFNNSEIKNENIPEATPTETNVSLEQYKDEAKAIVGFFDSLSCLFLPRLYRKKLLTKEEYLLAKELHKKIKNEKNAETNFSETEFEVYTKLLELEEYEESLPLTEKETEQIAQPLAEVMQKYGKKTSPELRLLFAIGVIYIPRTLILFSKR